MDIYLVDGTYELFRHFFALPSARDAGGNEIAAVRGVLASVLGLLEGGARFLGVATDHVIESFRNELYPGYKTGAGIDRALAAQFRPLEDALAAMGVKVWPMVDVEADDALAAAASKAAADPRVGRVLILTPDKDLAQCVVGDRVVQVDRRKSTVRNEPGVWERFGVGPASIPDWLALVGDAADGFPGLPGWGARRAAEVLARYGRLESIPRRAAEWEVRPRGAEALAGTLADRWQEALLFRTLATLRTDVPVFDSVDELLWSGPRLEFQRLAVSMNAASLWDRARDIGRGFL